MQLCHHVDKNTVRSDWTPPPFFKFMQLLASSLVLLLELLPSLRGLQKGVPKGGSYESIVDAARQKGKL